jgi:NitT/TauT family transport system permease protein
MLTALRVIIALVLSLAWTVPVGVAIGRNPKLAKLLQPIVQIAASVPATALFPVLLIALAQIGGGLQIGSIILMMLGTMWYVLFNVIAGAQSIPSDLFEVAKVYKLNRLQRWRTVILPGIFPYLITGIITAVGGAWNASIVSEYIEFQGKTVSTAGLGATISQATATGNFPLLLAATAVMSLLVVLTNRLVWRPLYRLANEKYQLLG